MSETPDFLSLTPRANEHNDKPPSAEIIGAERKASLSAVGRQEAEATELHDRAVECALALTENCDHEAFADEALAALVPDKGGELLAKAEAKRREKMPNLDLLKMPLELWAKAMKEELANQSEQEIAMKARNEQTETKAQAEQEEKNTDAYEDRVNALKAQEPKLSTKQILETLLAEDTTPDAEKARMQPFVNMIDLAQTPEDQVIITKAINRLDVAKLPSSENFVRAFIFDNPESQLQTGVSEATQEAIAKSLGIERHQPTIKSGQDAIDAFKNGYGTETYIDENGERQTRQIPLEVGQSLPVSEDCDLAIDEAGNKVLEIKSDVSDIELTLPDSISPEAMTQYIRTGQYMGMLRSLNLATVLYERPFTDSAGGKLKLRMPVDFIRTKELDQVFFGEMAGRNGEVLTQSDLDKIPYLMQFHSSKGDAMRGDVDPELMRQDLEAQGVIENEEVNWERFEKLVTANRENMFIAPEDFAKSSE